MTVKWQMNLRPNETESEFREHGVVAVRSNLDGTRMEVRLFDTTKDGCHILWSIGRSGDELFVQGKIFCNRNNAEDVVAAYELGKELAEKFARCWKQPSPLRSVS